MDLFAISCYAFSIFNLMLLTLLLWLRKNNNTTNKIFGLYILLLTIPLILNVLTVTGFLQSNYYFLCLLPAMMLGPVAYTFYLQFIQIELPLKQLLLKHYAPAATVALVLTFITIALQHNLIDNHLSLFKGPGIPNSFRSIIVIHACVYHFYCWRLSQKLQMQETYSQAVQNKISWIHDFFRNAVIICTLFIVFHTLRSGFLGYTPVGSSVITPLLLLLSYFLILHKSLSYLPVFAGVHEHSTEIPKGAQDKKPLPAINEEQLALLAQKLTAAMEQEQLFKNQALNLQSLSAHLDIQPRILSQFIHQQHQTNFSDFVNQYRVEESKSLMQNPAMHHLKLEAIAEASGFTSRASFFSIFKKVTGLTPAMFRKEHAL